MIKIDGSGRIEHRNRKYLRKFKPMESKSPYVGHKLPPVVDNGDGSAQDGVRTQDCSPGTARPSMDTRYSVIGGGENGDGENKLDLSLDLSHDPGSFVTPPTTPMKSPAAESTPDSLARSEVRPPGVTPTRPALAPTRRSDRTIKPNNKYSAKEYDLSVVWCLVDQ